MKEECLMFIRLDAEITEDDQLNVQLPDDLPPGKVKLAIEYIGGW